MGIVLLQLAQRLKLLSPHVETRNYSCLELIKLLQVSFPPLFVALWRQSQIHPFEIQKKEVRSCFPFVD